MSIQNINLTFGEWVQREREEQDLSLQTLAEKANISASTINRIERQKAQTTLLTAIQISQGLGHRLIDYMAAAYPPRKRQHLATETNSLEPRSPTLADPTHKQSAVISGQDIHRYLALYHESAHAGHELLCNWLNRIGGQLNRNMGNPSNRGNPSKSWQPDDIVAMLDRSSLYRFDLEYPSQIKRATIIEFWQQGGIVMPEDVDMLLKQIAHDSVFVSGFMGKTKDALRRLSITSLRSVSLDDIIELDQMLDIGLLEMFCAAAQFSEWSVSEVLGNDGVTIEAIHWREDQSRLVYIFMIISRWLAYLAYGSTSWLEQMRNEIEKAHQHVNYLKTQCQREEVARD